MILGLPPMTQYDRNATPMLGCFTATPDLTAYANIGRKVDLEARNPAKGPGATASNKLDFSGPDRADPDALNAIFWHALKPGQPVPAPVRSAPSDAAVNCLFTFGGILCHNKNEQEGAADNTPLPLSYLFRSW